MSKHRILVIEDQDDVRENIVELLELSNYTVYSAQNGKEGIKSALDSPPDLILCDIMMPEMDGYEVLYLLSKNPETASLPFIFLTAKAEKSDFRKGMNMGADDYITKPFEEMELLGAIERRLKKYEELSSISGMDQLVEHAAKYQNIQELEKERKVQTFKRKEIIYREGDYGNFVYKILKGKVKSYHINKDGKEFIHDLRKEGDFLGEQSVIQDTARTEFAEALDDTEMMLIPKDDFQELIFKNREVSGQFIKMLSNNLSQREKELMEMAYNTVRKRTADSLMKLYETYQGDQKNVTIDVSRADLAGMVGTATESVIRILSEFKKDKWIEINGSAISILEPEKIKAIKF
ncbi:cAMP-binding domain of CRP or a regulatory subunit of cAMP-dependent protein kinases [Ekhidna lutea]|uniref:cAMP-binding domain of CRP or a regulatory subunit of cAMP-dependent protein kinases n=1 Tax=Ekhidna lutea TaxID=447679 RepID=A0A239LAE6_EKHLU|nr:response regulator [Ekhidna lutea]SNT27250.1 cAMP-binding domain of CRP or a regulatory subunit of cAMP-dependent protein kinases [Ekhidna lutea]